MTLLRSRFPANKKSHGTPMPMLPSGITRKHIIYFFGAIILIYFCVTLILIQQLSINNVIKEIKEFSNDSPICNLNDSLVISALERVKTEACRESITDAYCNKIDINVTLKNTCPDFEKTQKEAYIGCFNESAPSLLRGYIYTFEGTNSPSTCVQYCLRGGYELAGLKASTRCYCGHKRDLKKAVKLDDASCHAKFCPNGQDYCGGIHAVTVLSTGLLTAVKRLVPVYRPLPDVDFDGQSETSSSVKLLFVLQLNGRNSRQVVRMLRPLYSQKHSYIVHVDSRQTYMFNEMKKLQKSLEKRGNFNFKVFEDRFPTIWGGSTLLTMFLSIIQWSINAKNNFTNWDYVLNLSESDMPLLSLAELEYNLFHSAGKSFLASHGYNTADFIRKQGFFYAFHQCESRMWRIKSRSKFPQNMRIDGGSDWVIVHRSLALTALEKNDSLSQQLLPYFDTILLPLEGFFHTLALNSHHCHDVVYKNLRLTNWRRQQGCRCATLKPVVDWCGCSPLVFRGTTDPRFQLSTVKSKAYFFARKFDSFVDVDAIAAAESQSLRLQPHLINELKQSPVFNATWINAFDVLADYDHPKRFLYEGIAKNIFRKWSTGQSIEKCNFDHLTALWAYKATSQAKPKPILIVNDGCGNRYHILLEVKNLTTITPDPAMLDFEIIDAEFGTSLDLKEEIFRDVLPVVDVTSKVTILLHWRQNQSQPISTNITSPLINLQWWNTLGRLVKHELIKPYNSIFSGQHATLDLNVINADIVPGLWSVRLPSRDSSDTVFETHFPVFPSDPESALFAKLVATAFAPADICSVDRVSPRVSLCATAMWSPEYPDPKADLSAFSLV